MNQITITINNFPKVGRKLFRSGALLLFCSSILLSTSCSTELHIHAEPDPQPVVYCLLEMDDSTQYLRMSKTYLDPDGLGWVTPHADSLIIYEPSRIYIEEYQDDRIANSWYFEKHEGFDKEQGFFPEKGQQWYQSHFRPKHGTRYALYIYFPDEANMVYGEMTTCRRPILHDPAEVPGRVITLSEEQHFQVRWTPAQFTAYYQGVFGFSWIESLDEEFDAKRIEMEQAQKLAYYGDFSANQWINGRNFLTNLANQIDVVPGVRRKVIHMDYTFHYAGEELALFNRSDQPASGAVAELPSYSNLTNAVGVFSSKGKIRISGIELSDLTVDTIAYGQITKQLGFIGYDEEL